MANPVKEDVARAIRSALLLINTGTSPYTFTPPYVIRPPRIDGFTPADGLLLLSQSDDDRDLGLSDGNACWRDIAVIYSVDCFCFPNADSNVDAIDTIRNAREADVITALMVDPQLGGLIVKGICLPTRLWDWNEFSGFTVPYEAHIRIKENDPRTGVS